MAKGEITHVEIPADDIERAKRFYTAVAGWEFAPTEGFPDYWLFRTSLGSGGAIGKRGETTGSVLRDYVTVPDLEEAVRLAEEHGGTVLVPARDVAGMGRYAAVTDSEGNEIGLWEVKEG